MSGPREAVSRLSDVVECSLWFNSSKQAMSTRLAKGKSNSGVGINIGQHAALFDPSNELVELRFDNGSEGRARVRKDSWQSCTHLIDESIGRWARGIGIWRRKLAGERVSVWIRKIDTGTYEVASSPRS